MTPLEDFAHWLIVGVLQMQQGSALGEALEFFVADIIKVFILLLVVSFIVGIIRTFVTPKRIKQWLGGSKEGLGNVFAAILGIPTPFCSCSAVPLFIGFLEAGVPLGVTFSFLIASPLINEVAIAMLLGLFSWEITALYIGSGLIIAVIAGIIIGRLHLEGEIEDFAYEMTITDKKNKKMSWKQRFDFAGKQSFDIVTKVAPYMTIGIGIGAFIHGFVPLGALTEIAGNNSPFAVPLVVIIGVPLYSNAAGMVPVVQALMDKGMAMGTALAFMMSVTALSLPEMIILRKVLKPKLIAIFAGILAIAFMLTGWLFNAILSKPL